jgi:type I restriction enzyme M protein
MRKDDGIDGDAQRIGQLVWMLFLKVFDQREEEWEDDAADKGESYYSPLPPACRWRNWAGYNADGTPKMGAEEMLNFVNITLFPTLKELPVAGNPKAKVIREVFRDAYNYMKTGSLLLKIAQIIDETINFHDFKERRHLGDIYEQILKDLQSAGNAGEFYTPRAVTQFIVNRANPHLGEKVLDPACGTGGFLTATIDHLSQQLDDNASVNDRVAIQNAIHGYEKKQLPHLLCTTNMLLHGIDVPSQIEHQNTLAKAWNDWKKTEQVDVVVTNPPFGGKEDDGVGLDFPTSFKTRETADMFITLIIKKLLKPHGRAAVVLPDGFLFGDGLKAKIKELLLTECNLHTIVRLPNGVFNPYTGIKTNLLFFTKGKPTETIWFYEHPYPDGVKSYNKTKPMRFAEFEPEIAWWGDEADGFSARVENEQAWKVDFAALKADAERRAQPHRQQAEMLKRLASGIGGKIKDLPADIPAEEIAQLKQQLETLNQQAKEQQQAGDAIYNAIFNLDCKNPHQPDELSHDPEVLLSQYATQQQEIGDLQQQLKTILNAALS